MWLVLTGSRIDAQEARRIGLVNQVPHCAAQWEFSAGSVLERRDA